jgi:hypothetical protein
MAVEQERIEVRPTGPLTKLIDDDLTLNCLDDPEASKIKTRKVKDYC